MGAAITISEDRLRAILELAPGEALDGDALAQALAAAGVRAGIDGQAAAAAAVPAAEPRSLAIAQGRPPVPAPPPKLVPPPDAERPRAVVRGERVAELVPEPGGEPGMGVDGIPLPAPVERPRFGRGLADAHDGWAVALRDGVYAPDGYGHPAVLLPGVIERQLQDILIQSDPRELEAWIRFDPGQWMQADDLHRCLAAAGVHHGLDAHAIAAASLSEPGDRTLMVARATLARDGEHAWVEHLITEPRALVEDEDGRVDFHQGRMVEVDRGQPLARKHPATLGVPGTGVRGRVLPAKDGHDLDDSLVYGPNTGPDPADPGLIVAAVGGIYIRTRSGAPSVSPEAKIAGDVDMHVGNLITRFPIRITGDIKKSFIVRSEADIQVGGSIEDARVTAQAGIVVRGGILPGEQRVKSRGDIAARHVSGRTVKCRDLIVQAGITGSRIMAKGRVEARDIHSAMILAAGGVICDTLGDHTEQRVAIEAGVDPEIEMRLAKAQAELIPRTAAVAEAKANCKGLAMRFKGMHPEQVERRLREALLAFDAACAALAEIEAQLAQLEPAAQEIAARADAVQVAVKREVFPGAEIRIGRARPFHVRDRLRACTFIVKDGAVAPR